MRNHAAGRIGGVGTPAFPSRRLGLVGVALAAVLMAAAPAFAQFNLPQPSTALPGSGGARIAPSPRVGAPPVASLPPGTALPAPGNTGLPGIDPRQCGSSPHSALCAKGRWLLFSNIDMRVTAPGFAGAYAMAIAQNNEVHATYRETVRGKTREGEIVLVGQDGVAFRSGESFPDGAPVLDIMISTPIMSAQLVALLLDMGVIGPPSDVTAPRPIRAESATQFIRTSAPNAAMLYGPPWRMTGTAKPGTAQNTVAFALKLAYRPVDGKGKLVAGRTDTISIEGSADFSPRPATLPDAFELTGFTLLRDETRIAAQRTVGDARRAISR